MAFKDLDENKNNISFVTGAEIYANLRKRFPEESMEHYDLILNSLCMALTCLIKSKVKSDHRLVFAQLIHKIITNNFNNM